MQKLNRAMPRTMISRIERQCAALIGKNAFVFLLGGEHTVTLGALQALALVR